MVKGGSIMMKSEAERRRRGLHVVELHRQMKVGGYSEAHAAKRAQELYEFIGGYPSVDEVGSLLVGLGVAKASEFGVKLA